MESIVKLMRKNMNKYSLYFKYVMRHKWYVMLECFKKGKFKRGLLHDISKLLPDEFIPYAKYFYSDFNQLSKEDSLKIKREFDLAWLRHQKRNPHHWQYWVLHEDSGKCIKLDMPDAYIIEMVCDWRGAGLAIKGKDDTNKWYSQNRMKMLLSESTRQRVEELVGVVYSEPLNTEDAPYFHELSVTQMAEAMISGSVYLSFKQPDWCPHPDSLDWNTGCWSLTEGKIRSKKDCKGCLERWT